ncbi:MAG: 3D domain-containing protein [Desulfotignum sp.]|nr:3D domain-containing protein [Desulfotignum sp.]
MKKSNSEKLRCQIRIISARFHTGLRMKAAGVVFCVFLFSLGMIDKNLQKSDPDQILYHIERLYLIKDLPGTRSRFRWYTPLVAQMEQIRGELREVTAYNAGDEDQCSGDPCISASGENLCDTVALGYNRCAANFVPLGTRLHIETLGEFVVVDRMHKRFGERVDIAMGPAEKNRAKVFGLQRLKVTVLDRQARLARAQKAAGK